MMRRSGHSDEMTEPGEAHPKTIFAPLDNSGTSELIWKFCRRGGQLKRYGTTTYVGPPSLVQKRTNRGSLRRATRESDT